MSALVKPLIVLALIATAVGWYVFGPGARRVDPRAEAEAAAARRDFPAARAHLDHYLATAPTDRDTHLLAARVARRTGDAPASEAHLRRFADLGGDRELVALERALTRIEGGDPTGSGAVFEFCKARPDHPAVPFALESLTIGMRKIGQADQAENCANEWLRRVVTPAEKAAAHVGRGLALEMKGLTPEAAVEYRRAIALVPGHVEGRYKLAEFLTRDEPTEALGLFRGLVAEQPDRPEVRLGMARCHRQLGDHAAAAGVLGPLLRSRPDDPDVLAEAGVLALDRGRPDEAQELLRRAVEKAPTQRWSNVQLLRCYQERGMAAEAETQKARVKQIDDELEKRIAAMTRKP